MLEHGILSRGFFDNDRLGMSHAPCDINTSRFYNSSYFPFKEISLIAHSDDETFGGGLSDHPGCDFRKSPLRPE
jgi:hypothetical protein